MWTRWNGGMIYSFTDSTWTRTWTGLLLRIRLHYFRFVAIDFGTFVSLSHFHCIWTVSLYRDIRISINEDLIIELIIDNCSNEFVL